MKKCVRCGKPIKRGKTTTGGAVCKECYQDIASMNVIFEEYADSEDSDRNI